MTNIDVVNGDITRIRSDALVAAINSKGQWLGGIDDAIKHASGTMFHRQALAAMPLHDGQTIFAPEQGNANGHTGLFDAVLFVVDDLQRPIDELVTLALKAAVTHELLAITIPAIRTGAQAGVYEPRKAALTGLANAVNKFVLEDASLDKITLVAPSNEGDRILLRSLCVTPY